MSEPAADQPDLPADLLRQTMGRFATGVTVVSTILDGQDHAMTAGSVASVSLEPPLIMVSVEVESRFHDAVLEAGRFAMSILTAGQRPQAQWFATRGRPLIGQFDQVAHHRDPTGCALIDGALAHVSAQVVAGHPAGDHTLVVARVTWVDLPASAEPALVHYRSRMVSLD